MRFEYLAYELPREPSKTSMESVMTEFNRHGSGGWMLVGFYGRYAIFRRVKS